WDCICRPCSSNDREQADFENSRPKRSFRSRSRPPCEGIGHRAHSRCWSLSNYPCSDYISRRYLTEDSRPKRSFHFRSTPPWETLGGRGYWWSPLGSTCRPCTHPTDSLSQEACNWRSPPPLSLALALRLYRPRTPTA